MVAVKMSIQFALMQGYMPAVGSPPESNLFCEAWHWLRLRNIGHYCSNIVAFLLFLFPLAPGWLAGLDEKIQQPIATMYCCWLAI